MNPFFETLLRTATTTFSPQIVAALKDCLVVMERYDARLERMETMLQTILLREGAPVPPPRISDERRPDAS
jgi:hypothetical protein